MTLVIRSLHYKLFHDAPRAVLYFSLVRETYLVDKIEVNFELVHDFATDVILFVDHAVDDVFGNIECELILIAARRDDIVLKGCNHLRANFSSFFKVLSPSLRFANYIIELLLDEATYILA